MLMRKSSERSRSHLKPRFPRLEILRRRREIDEQFVDTIGALIGDHDVWECTEPGYQQRHLVH